MYDVISIGSAVQDVFLNSKHFRVMAHSQFGVGEGLCVPFGSKIAVDKMVFASGGGATNAAVTFARQGFRTACIGRVGDDEHGRMILDELRREGIDAKYVHMESDQMTGFSVVLVADRGERTILFYRGEGEHWQTDQVPWGQLQAKWCYVNSLGGSEEMLAAITAWARQEGAHLATNPGGKELGLGLERLIPYWKHFDIVGMNQEEAAGLTGIPYDQPEQIFKKMDDVIGGIFIMTRGQEGSVVSDGHFIYSADIPRQEAVERTGAGDAFHSGFVAEFMRSGSIEKSIQRGTANATSVVMQYGAKAGVLRKNESGPWPLVKVEKMKL